MVISNNVMAIHAQWQLQRNALALATSLERLSSGQRINRAGDDAAGLAISEKMRAQITSIDTATRNAMDGISMVQTAEGSLNEVHSMLNRMTELATRSANGIFTETERGALDAEFQQLKSEIDRVSQGTNFNGRNLLDGSMSGANQSNLQIGATSDSHNMIGVGINNMGTGGIGLSGVNISTIEGAKAAIDSVRDAVNTVSTQRGSLGATQNRLDHVINNNSVAIENLTAAESRIRDTDMAKEMMNFTKSSILLQASQAMLAQANMVPQSVISLLR